MLTKNNSEHAIAIYRTLTSKGGEKNQKGILEIGKIVQLFRVEVVIGNRSSTEVKRDDWLNKGSRATRTRELGNPLKSGRRFECIEQ